MPDSSSTRDETSTFAASETEDTFDDDDADSDNAQSWEGPRPLLLHRALILARQPKASKAAPAKSKNETELTLLRAIRKDVTELLRMAKAGTPIIIQVPGAEQIKKIPKGAQTPGLKVTVERTGEGKQRITRSTKSLTKKAKSQPAKRRTTVSKKRQQQKGTEVRPATQTTETSERTDEKVTQSFDAESLAESAKSFYRTQPDTFKNANTMEARLSKQRKSTTKTRTQRQDTSLPSTSSQEDGPLTLERIVVSQSRKTSNGQSKKDQRQSSVQQPTTTKPSQESEESSWAPKHVNYGEVLHYFKEEHKKNRGRNKTAKETKDPKPIGQSRSLSSNRKRTTGLSHDDRYWFWDMCTVS